MARTPGKPYHAAAKNIGVTRVTNGCCRVHPVEWNVGEAAGALVYMVALWAVVTGVLEVAAAVRLRRQIRGEWLLLLTGVVSILVGILMAALPVAGVVALAFWIGSYAIVFGVLLIALAFRVRRVSPEFAQA